MSKTITGALAAHLGLQGTTLTTLWVMTRVDGVSLYFTELDIDVPFEGNTYEAAVGYNRTAVANQVGLSVDNLDVQGFLDSSAITDIELRAGLYDFAEVRISIVNYEDLSQGALRMRRGKMGEVTYSDSGFFEAELRGLAQAYSQRIVELYEPECRANLGDFRCKINLFPTVADRLTAYAVGDQVRASPALENVPDSDLFVPADVDADDTSENGATATLGTEVAVQTVQKVFGAGSIEFTPTGATPRLNSQNFVSYPDLAAYAIGANEFSIEGWVRFKDLTDTIQTIAAHSNSNGDQRAWILRRNGANLEFFVSDDGTAVAPAVTISGAFAWVIDTDYHVAVTRDENDDIRMFVAGTQVGSTTAFTPAVHDSTAALYLGKERDSSGVADENALDGFIDDFRFVVGHALYTTAFTPPVAALFPNPDAVIATLLTVDYEDIIYTCTVAGTTDVVQPVYDTTIGNPTVDGAATFTAAEAFTMAGTVTSVTDQRTFSLSFDNGPDSREVTNWFRYGAVGWETGNNAFSVGLSMEVKTSEPSVTTGVTTLSVSGSSTFTRPAGSFLTDGFLPGMLITTANFTNGANNGTFEVLTVAAGTLTIVETTLVVETGTADETMTSDERITLFLTMPFVIQVGDQFSIYAGCDTRLTTCINKFANVTNMRAEPYLPGQDAFVAVQVSR